MILADAIWLSIGNLPFLEFWEFFLVLLFIMYLGKFLLIFVHLKINISI